MHDLTAKVTSSLLPFPRVTTDALGEDETAHDSVLHGSFTVGKTDTLSSLVRVTNVFVMGISTCNKGNDANPHCVCVCVGRAGLAWLACGPHLEVVRAMTGERLSAYCFSGRGEHPPTVLAARDFSWLKRSVLRTIETVMYRSVLEKCQ